MKAFSKHNDGYNYLLLVIDIFSKYGWIIPLENKKGKTVADALKTIFKERKPEKLWTDRVKSFMTGMYKIWSKYIVLRMRKKVVLLKDGLGQ